MILTNIRYKTIALVIIIFSVLFRIIIASFIEFGNDEVYYYSESLAPLGLPAFIYILEDGEATSNITVSGDSEITNVSENSEVNYSLKIENLASVPTGQLTFELKSTNIRVNAVSQAGSSACSVSSVNYNSTVSCALSGVDANASKL